MAVGILIMLGFPFMVLIIIITATNRRYLQHVSYQKLKENPD